MATRGLKAIASVPTADDFLDIVLSKTQRKTPTVIHKNFKISLIRNFYMRKVKFTQDSFDEKFSAILEEFRMLDLKRAVPRRMDTVMRRQKDPLAYLEQVRQHISRLPAIDPTTRTLICGYPNVGKCSFINKKTPARMRTCSCMHSRRIVIDTPGLLDHPLEEMTAIEMQSIIVLAHLRECVLYFIDLSEHCGYTVEAQCKLFHPIKPTSSSSTKSIPAPKTYRPPRCVLDEITAQGDVRIVQASCYSEEGVMDVKNTVCDLLLVPFILETIRRRLEKDLEAEEGGAGVYNLDMRKKYLLAMDEWKYDKIPEIMEGKNVADFIDRDIAEKREALKREKERLQAEGFYDEEEDFFDSAAELDDANTKRLESQETSSSGTTPSRLIQERVAVLVKAHAVARKRKRNLEGDEEEMEMDGKSEDAWMDVDEGDEGKGAKKKGLGRSGRMSEGGEAVVVKTRGQPATNSKTISLRNLAQRTPNRLAKAGESDRAIKTSMPKHLFAEKRKIGKTNRR
ncbi:hypothetical protein M422DRAFT_268881 [Sphaerobolus stellatus SS14]|uniref:Nucleolar GTP-binding protein 1 n=1 Tax=Sphaerobolus stellatus (strain SS14) TaxID=990650 RepID=A0A0C9U5T7_SPHS4|nr:hypothetical protein M422DRAFT_268881 [Sphaerobolus stellatus SS14]